MFFMLSFDACAYDCLLDLEVELATKSFVKNFDFAKMLLLGLGGISGGTLEIFACFPLAEFFFS